MESSPRENGSAERADGPSTAKAYRRGAQVSAGDAAQALSHLLLDVQDLLHSVTHLADPQISQIRSKVESALAATTQAVADGTLRVRRGTTRALASGDRYVRDRPWQTAGVAAAVGLLVGVFATSRWSRRR